ncbi:MAG: hypothetical protein LBV59_00415 [Sphingobacterium sp.]|uniref:hypothetical protein n=1 Tax=Sphingobacterium sp. TaxID=341027 RepID=UPI00284FC0A7|nr:hypothetical protein [Sphingobacterium sp.]MDR3006362.1 hypothetical protein [Sphingobacterium sp.]
MDSFFTARYLLCSDLLRTCFGAEHMRIAYCPIPDRYFPVRRLVNICSASVQDLLMIRSRSEYGTKQSSTGSLIAGIFHRISPYRFG